MGSDRRRRSWESGERRRDFLIQEIEVNKLDPSDSALEAIAAIVGNFVEAVTP